MATPAPPKPTRRAQFLAGSAKAAAGSASYMDDRLGLGRWLKPNLRKLFPGHWSFLLGEFALYSFVLLILTGTFLTFFYKATPTEAFPSVAELTMDVRGGLLIRQMHHWSATIFVLSIVAHLFRVFFTAAFRKPRELTWMLGVILFATVLFESFLGFSLTGDQMAFAGLREGDALLLSIPLIGTYLSNFAFGGGFPGEAIPRLFVAHVLLVPGILLAIVPLHAIVLTWRQKHTEKRASGSDERRVTGGPFFPYFALKQGITSLGTFTVITALATLSTYVTLNTVWQSGAYQPGVHPPAAQPFWYAGVLEGGMRLTPGWEITIGGYHFSVGLWIPMLILTVFFTLLFFYPFIERRLTGDRLHHNLLDRPRQAPKRTAFGFAAITFFTVMWAATWVSPDGPGSTAMLTVPHETYTWIVYGLRIALFVLPPVVYAITLSFCRRR